MARRYSAEYKNLQPYVVEDIRKVFNVTGASGSGGTLEPHGLDSRYHTGELAQTQASWAATKVELVNHAALPDVHHARSHSIISSSDHTVTGSQYQIVGLTSTNTLGLLTAASSPTTNQVVKTDGSSAVTLVDLTVSSDLFVTGTLDFGTNTIYEDASYLQVAGSKAVRFGQNIGNAAWTIYNAGGASFGGSVEIVGSGDLYVAGSLGGAGGVLKTSGNRVGIACVPDSQFALDVAGPARAQYFIGPHAIQVKDAIMICHYDGRQPFNTNFSGEPNGHFGQVASISGGVIFPPGKFSKAVQIAKATTNYFSDPSCEYDATLSLWSKTSGGVFTVSRSVDVVPLYGTYVGKLVTTTHSGLLYQSLTMSATTIAITAYVRKADKSAITVADAQIHYAGDQTTTYTNMGDGWYRLRWFGTGTGAAAIVGLRVWSGRTVYVDGLQIEYGNASPFCDGSLGTEHTWSGTAHASNSSRVVAALAYTLPYVALDAPLTIMAWVNLDTTAAENYNYLWYPSDDNYSAYRNSSELIVGTINCGSMPAGWVHVAFVTTGGGGTTAYVNGVSKGTASITRANLTNFYVGSRGAAYYANGLIDDFALIGRELPAAEIRSIYESNAPIFAETSTFSFRPTPKGLIWADDEGLWMRDTAGSPVLGAYGGEAATKSWAGFTMAAGDIAIGSNAVGSSAIWWDKSAGTFGFYGAGSATAQASVATDGSITAGAGALVLNSSGIQITAPSTQTDIGSYKFLVTGKTITSGMYAYYNSGADIYYHGLYSDSSNIGNITTVIGSSLGGGGTSKIQFIVSNNLTVSSSSYTLSGSSLSWWLGDGNTVYVGIGTAAAPTRPFQVLGGVFAGGEDTGLAGYTQLTNTVNTSLNSGTGTVKMAGATSRNNVGWLKMYSGTTAIYVPYWTTITG